MRRKKVLIDAVDHLECRPAPTASNDTMSESPRQPAAAGQSSEHKKKQRTKNRKSGRNPSSSHTAQEDTAPVASTSKAVYVPPAAEVQRYSRGKPASTKTVSLATSMYTF